MNNWGRIYDSTWWGNPQQNGWGSSYYSIANPITPNSVWGNIMTLWKDLTITYSGT